MIKSFKCMIQNDEGATLIEYAMIVTIVALVGILGFKALGSSISTKAVSIGTDITNSSV